ncbi:MAG: ubiquitin-activating E1 FCCH domain-containing protein [Candidatus Bathyarchaeota archaeon]|jgi:hypothetical protein
MFNPPSTALDQIKLKIRRITKSPNPTQLTDQQIVDYVNWYYLYDFPEELRLKSLKTNYIFFTEANEDRYRLPVNRFVSVEPPLYIAGFESWWSQNQDEFYRQYPKNAELQNRIATGNGTAGPYTFTLSTSPVLKQCVTITTQDSGGNGIALIDDGEGNFIEADQTTVSISNSTQANPVQVTAENHLLSTGDTITIFGVNGMTELNGNTYVVNVINANNFTLNGIDGTGFTAYTSGGSFVKGVSSFGTINYTTGAVSVTFRLSIPSGTDIDASAVPYTASRPFAALFYNNEFILRPVPDRGYKVEVAAFRNPSDLLDDSQDPTLNEWWELIALGAALKIFTDRRELQVLAQYKPLYEEQLLHATRRTIIQQRNQRAATIYTDQLQHNAGRFFNNY